MNSRSFSRYKEDSCEYSGAGPCQQVWYYVRVLHVQVRVYLSEYKPKRLSQASGYKRCAPRPTSTWAMRRDAAGRDALVGVGSIGVSAVGVGSSLLKNPGGNLMAAAAQLQPGSSLLGAADAYRSHRLLFLDVDGVLNTLASCVCPRAIVMPGWPGPLSKPLLLRLGNILRSTDALIVLSSTWRLYENGRLALMCGLQQVGISPQDVIVGATPSMPGRPRAHEIAEWLADHGPCMSWSAVDDIDLWSEDPSRMNGHCVRTQIAIGLTQAGAAEVIRQLLGQEMAAGDDQGSLAVGSLAVGALSVGPHYPPAGSALMVTRGTLGRPRARPVPRPRPRLASPRCASPASCTVTRSSAAGRGPMPRARGTGGVLPMERERRERIDALLTAHCQQTVQHGGDNGPGNGRMPL